MPDDYGYFGKGQTGYAHYMQAFDRNNKTGGKKPDGQKSGCLTTLALVTLVAVGLIHLLSHTV